MQKLMSLMRSAMEQYEMIEENDVVAVGVSGGKDSMALLVALAELRRFYPVKFDVIAVTLDPCFNGVEADYSQIQELCNRHKIKYIIRRTQLAQIIFDDKKEKNPCSLCARMRRGILHDIARENGCKKIALGHHSDDAVQTLLMNMFIGGNVGSFSPVTYLSRKDITMIRPMIFARETAVESVAKRYNLPIVKSKCPVDKKTQREHMKAVVASLDKEFGQINQKLIGAMQRGNISRW